MEKEDVLSYLERQKSGDCKDVVGSQELL